ncbi:MAG: hypothetical protein IKI24_04280 [Clostridia bacterium]|nr:hypothetical protein [Clostridia bacterium]
MFRRFFRLLPALLTWALVCIMFWGWIFSILTDTPASKKLIVYVDAPLKNTRELAGRLEDHFPRSQIRFIEIRSFSYSMMGDSPAADGDIFIIPSGSAEEYSDWFGDMPAEVFLSPAADAAPLSSYVLYPEGKEYLLFYSASSVHTGKNDSLAFELAELLKQF